MASKKGRNTEAQKGPVDTSSQYAELSKLQQIQDWDKAAKLCNKILNVSPSDGLAFHCKIVCLLQMQKFQEVLKQINDPGNQKFGDLDLSFEEAYCHYRLNEASKALKVLDSNIGSSKKEGPKHRELRAQILYRLERFSECFDIYRDIIKNSMVDDEFEEERMTNLAAVSANLEYEGEAKNSFPDQDNANYEMIYNRACYHLAAGRWNDACDDLKKSEELCKEASNEDNEDEDDAGTDLMEETGIIRVQLGYALQMQDSGHEREAQAIYNSVLKSKPSDIGLIAVASNNMLCLNKDQNIFDSKKRIKAATVEGLEHKLTSKHQAAIARNNTLLAMYTNQVDLCKSLGDALLKDGTISSDEMAKINAGVLSRSGKAKEAVEILMKLYHSGKKENIEPLLIAAQIFLEKGDVNDAITILEENLPIDIKLSAGVLSTLVSLCLAVENRPKAANLLKEAVSNKKGSSKSKSSDMSMIWRKTAEFHLKGDEPSVASQSLEELLKVDPNNVQTKAQLVLAYAKYDLKKALEASKKLPKFTEQSKIDVDSLESSSFVSAKYGKKTPKPGDPTTPKKPAETTSDAEEAIKKKKKRKHKKRLPKTYDPNVDPDPERWVPRRERTGYRRTRKERRKGEKFTGAQGTSASQQETYDYSQKKAAAEGAIKKQKSPQVIPEPPVGPRQQRGKPQPKKKKGKKQF